MTSASRTPPRFVPTLTEVIDAERDSAAAEAKVSSAGEVPVPVPMQQPEMAQDPLGTWVVPGQGAAFHSPWLADGLYARRGMAGLPRALPPLPEALPPQPSLIASTITEQVADARLETAPLPQAESPELGTGAQAVCGQKSVNVDGCELSSAGCWQQQTQEGLVANALASAVSEEDLVHRLMQRVDLVLEQRLREAIAQVVQEQTHSMELRLRQEVETVVRQSVYEAMESELSKQGDPPES